MSEYTRIAERARAQVAPKRVLVAFERSGIVRDAFIEAGHDAISCDLEPTDRPGPHHQGDARPLMRLPWDLVIAHPPCTVLALIGQQWLWKKPERWKQLIEAACLFNDAYCANAPMIAVENPRPHPWAIKLIGKPDQYVQPWHYGEPYTKATGLWLRGLPPLLATVIHPTRDKWYHGQFGGGVVATAREAAQTFPGMAAAMALQWGSL